MTARIEGFDTRADLKLVKPRSVSKRIAPAKGGCAAHYGGPAQRVSVGHDRCRRRWREWQTFHMGAQRGWSDIAYTGGFCDHGFALAGRGFGVRTAANGTNQANDRFYAFAWLGGEGEAPTRAALDALEWWVLEARERGDAGLAVKSHQDFKQTACAGRVLHAHVKTLDGRPIQRAGAPEGGSPDEEDDVGLSPADKEWLKSMIDDRIRIVLRGETAEGRPSGHVANLRSIYEQLAALDVPRKQP